MQLKGIKKYSHLLVDMAHQLGTKKEDITRTFARIIEKNKHLKKIRFHDLRHSCATLLRREGVEMADIQKWLGHSQISTTEQIYAHFDYENHLESAKRISNTLSR